MERKGLPQQRPIRLQHDLRRARIPARGHASPSHLMVLQPHPQAAAILRERPLGHRLGPGRQPHRQHSEPTLDPPTRRTARGQTPRVRPRPRLLVRPDLSNRKLGAQRRLDELQPIPGTASRAL